MTMNIHMTTGTGTGPTELSAFDGALNATGIANYNLLRLSSVIPPETTIVNHEGQTIPAEVMPGGWGDRLYVVMAEWRASNPGDQAWAGIGWVQEKESGKGLFVEHEGTSEAGVRSDIQKSLEQLMKTRGIDFGEIHMVVQGAICEDKPVCAMAVAVYQSSGWDNSAQLMQ